MTQDMQEEKTFAPAFWTTLTRGSARVWLPIGGLAAIAAATAGVVFLLSPEKQHLLFDVALAIVAVFAALAALRYGVTTNAGKPHAELRSVTFGVATAGAILGLLLFTLHGRTVGWTQTPALVVGYALVMIVGGLAGSLLGAFCYWPAQLIGAVTGLDYAGVALIAGGLSGLAMAVLLMLSPDTGFGVQAASVVLGMLCGYRGALLHRRYAVRGGSR